MLILICVDPNYPFNCPFIINGTNIDNLIEAFINVYGIGYDNEIKIIKDTWEASGPDTAMEFMGYINYIKEIK